MARPRLTPEQITKRQIEQAKLALENLAAEDDHTRVYLEDLSRIPLLTLLQERKLARGVETTRRRFRLKVMRTPLCLRIAHEILSRVADGTLSYDRLCWSCPPDGIHRDDVRPKLIPHTESVKEIIARMEEAYRDDDRAEVRKLGHQAALLIEELGLRPTKFKTLVDRARQTGLRMAQLEADDPFGRELMDLRVQAMDDSRGLLLDSLVMEDLDAKYGRIREAMTAANARMVITLAKKYKNIQVPVPDLIQEGNVGLLVAVERFDYRRGFKFSTYATTCIRQGFLRAIANQSKVVRLPPHLASLAARARRAMADTPGADGKPPDMAAVAKKLGVSVEQAKTALELDKTIGSIHALMPELDGLTHADILPDYRAATVEKTMDETLLKENVQSVLECLPLLDRTLLQLRFGLGDGHAYSTPETAFVLNLTAEEVDRGTARAVALLRDPLYGSPLEPFAHLNLDPEADL